MCGLAGFASWKNFAVSSQAENILSTLSKRGPDDSGVTSGSWFQAMHTRLSILDLSSNGHQPMEDASGRYMIVFNGEIYNFREINEQLASMGVLAQSQSDTEAFLNLFARQNFSAFEKLYGMFAGAIFDKQEKAVYLFRDRVGVKPLYYWVGSNQIAFGSTPDVVRSLSGQTSIDSGQFCNYLAFRSASVDGSFFSGVKALKPGTVLKITETTSKEYTFWDLASLVSQPTTEMDQEEATETIRSLLSKAVERRMVSDVPVGTFLSGGLDSTIIAHLMRELSDDEIRAHTFTSLSKDTDEADRARRTAEHYKTGHNIVDINFSGYLEDIEYLTEKKAAPLTVPNEYAIFKMSQEMKRHNTVVLSGEGADELFWGYSNVYTAAIEDDGRIISKDDMCKWIFDRYRYVSPEALRRAGFSQKFCATYIESGYQYVGSVLSELDGGKLSDNVQYFFLRHHLPSLLMRLDNATMCASVEGRVPFTDHELIEFGLRVPKKFKLGDPNVRDGYTGKKILYETFNDVPSWVTNVSKIGFKLGDTLPRSSETENLFGSAGLDIDGCYDDSIINSMERWHIAMLAVFGRQHGESIVA